MHQMVAQRGCVVSILEDIQEPSVHSLGNLLSVTLLEQGCWTRWSQEVSYNFNYSVFSFAVKILSYLPLLLRANADPSRSGFLSGHLILKDTSTYILLSGKVAYIFLQEFYNRRNNPNKIWLYRKEDFIPNSYIPNSNNLSLNRNSSWAYTSVILNVWHYQPLQ